MTTTVNAAAASRLRLSQPTIEYSPTDETERNKHLQNADLANFKKFEDIDLANSERLILVSANGTRYSVTVDNSGNLGTTAI
tara:strand:+ start:2324 stop:2569 length:246 start_codon:yes stop_codon:yes gene_type:complete